MRLLSIATLILLLSCTGRRDFNITRAQSPFDTLGLTARYDSFVTDIEKDFLSRMDTTDLEKYFESIGDSANMEDWARHVRNSSLHYFGDVFFELNTAQMVRDPAREVIHFTLLRGDYIELEISADGLLFSRNKEKTRWRPLDNGLWNRAQAECECTPDDDLEKIFMNFRGGGVYRVDKTTGGTYEFCWKILENGDVVQELLEEVR